jgi:hypothetical protein
MSWQAPEFGHMTSALGFRYNNNENEVSKDSFEHPTLKKTNNNATRDVNHFPLLYYTPTFSGRDNPGDGQKNTAFFMHQPCRRMIVVRITQQDPHLPCLYQQSIAAKK